MSDIIIRWQSNDIGQTYIHKVCAPDIEPHNVSYNIGIVRKEKKGIQHRIYFFNDQCFH